MSIFSFLPKHPAFTVVIPTFGYKGVTLTEKCVRSFINFHSHLGDEYELIVVEDSEDQDTLEYLERTMALHSKSIKVFSQPNGGFAKACNHGLRESNGQVVFLVNNDIEFTACSLQFLADAVGATRAGLIGTRLLYPDGRIQHGGVVYVPAQDAPVPGYFDHAYRGEFHLHPGATVMRPSLVTGALLGIPRSTLEVVGLLDEGFEFTCEDVDYNLRVIENGRDCVYFGYTSAFHHEGATRGKSLEEKQKLMPDVLEKEMRSLSRLFRKWDGVPWQSFMAV